MLEETLGSCAVSAVLHQNVQHNAVLIHRSPQIVQHAPDADEHLIEMPSVSWLRPSPAQLPGEVGTELQAPVPNALMGHHDAALGQDQLDVTQALAEDVIPPHGLVDDLGRKPVPRIGRGFECHAVSLSRPSSQRQPRLTWQCLSRVFLDPLLFGDQAPTEDQADAEERARLAAIAMWMH